MRVLSFFACYLFVVSCSPAPPAEPAGSAPPPSVPAPSAPAPEIAIASVTAGNPVIVEGRARTFENTVVIRLIDSRGELIRESFTTGLGDTGQHGPFRAEVFVTRLPGAKLTVQALEYSARDGSERSLVSETVDYRVAPISADLYFHDTQKSPTDCSRVFPQRRELPRSVAMARLLVEALVAEPGSPFPQGSAVESVVLRDGVVTVDFNERLQNVGGSCAVQAIRASVEQTLEQLPAVKRVVITAAGSEKLALQP